MRINRCTVPVVGVGISSYVMDCSNAVALTRAENY